MYESFWVLEHSSISVSVWGLVLALALVVAFALALALVVAFALALALALGYSSIAVLGY